MPKKMERALRKQARKKGMKGKRADRYVYGSMVNAGWRPKKRSKKKG